MEPAGSSYSPTLSAGTRRNSRYSRPSFWRWSRREARSNTFMVCSCSVTDYEGLPPTLLPSSPVQWRPARENWSAQVQHGATSFRRTTLPASRLCLVRGGTADPGVHLLVHGSADSEPARRADRERLGDLRHADELPDGP